MAAILIACSMLEDEITQIMEQERLPYPVCWMPRGLHASSERLRAELQAAIDEQARTYDAILLGYCLCGGGLCGLHSSGATLAVMDCCDCVHMLLQPEDADPHSLYFTAGWLRSEQFIGKEYQQTLLRRGPEKTKRAYAAILKGYTRLCMLDTGAYDLPTCAQAAQEAARLLGLAYDEEPCSTSILRQLLTQQRGAHILRIPPGGSIPWP